MQEVAAVKSSRRPSIVADHDRFHQYALSSGRRTHDSRCIDPAAALLLLVQLSRLQSYLTMEPVQPFAAQSTAPSSHRFRQELDECADR